MFLSAMKVVDRCRQRVHSIITVVTEAQLNRLSESRHGWLRSSPGPDEFPHH